MNEVIEITRENWMEIIIFYIESLPYTVTKLYVWVREMANLMISVIFFSTGVRYEPTFNCWAVRPIRWLYVSGSYRKNRLRRANRLFPS